MGTRSKLGILTLFLVAVSIVPLVVPAGDTGTMSWEDATGSGESSPTRGDEATAQEAGSGEPRGDEPPVRGGRTVAATKDEAPQSFERDAVYGQVCDEKGGALVGVAVELLQERAHSTLSEKLLSGTKSDGNGRFRFAALQPFTRYLLRAHCEGHVPAHKAAFSGQNARLTLPRASALFGQVLRASDKAPMQGVTLSFFPSGQYWERPITARSDERGNYRLGCVPADEISIWIRREGAVPEARSVRIEADKPTQHDLLLQDLVLRTGEVVDAETGAPIGGAEIRDHTQERAVLATTDAGGRFSLPCPKAIRVSLRVSAPGYAPSRFQARADATATVRIPLLKGAVLEGIVMDSAGKPLADARVTAVSTGRPRNAADRKALEERRAAAKARIPKMPSGVNLLDDISDLAVWTDADGRFRMSGLVSTSGLLVVAARAKLAGYSEASSAPVELLSTGGAVASVIVQMARGAAVEGTVSADKKPARAGIQLFLAAAEGPSVSTNDGGEYRIADLPAGQASVQARLTEYQFIQERAAIALTEGAVTRKDFDLELRVETIRGRVMEASGAPAAGVRVNARNEVRGEGVRGQDGSQNFSAKTVEDGSFQIPVPKVTGAQFTVSASKTPASVTKRGVLPSGDPIELALPALGKILLRVVDEDDGTAIPTVHVQWKNAERRSFDSYGDGNELRPGPDGAHTLTLPVGPVDLLVNASGSSHLQGRADGILVSAEPVPCRIALRRAGALQLRFLGEGSPPQGHQWFLEKGDANTRSRSSRNFDMEPSGLASFHGLEPGTWRLRVEPADIVLEPAEIAVRGGAQGSMEIRWSRKQKGQ